ncbi:MAG: hypothetical protein ACYS1A_08150 [Planctomycetota bacterium]|jgi:hypothetical protein
MALKELYEASIFENDFWMQVAGAQMTAAKDIENEDPGTTNHANRLIWAGQVDVNVKEKTREMLVDVLKNATIAADVANALDSDVQFVVNSLIDTYATG